MDATSTSDGSIKALCPICGAARVPAYRPFCSKRCADLDLHRWMNGAYALPADESDEGYDALGTGRD